MSRAVPLWNRTVKRVVVVEMRRPTFLLITTHRDSRIYKTNKKTVNMSFTGKLYTVLRHRVTNMSVTYELHLLYLRQGRHKIEGSTYFIKIHSLIF